MCFTFSEPRIGASAYVKQRGFFQNDGSHGGSRDAVPLQRPESEGRRARVNCDEQAAGGLRIEKKFLILARNLRSKSDAIANECAVVLLSAGQMTFSGGFERARQ